MQPSARTARPPASQPASPGKPVQPFQPVLPSSCPPHPHPPPTPPGSPTQGDVPIAPAGQGTKQSSPLITAFVLGLAATGGGLLLSTIEDVAVKGTDGAAPAVAIAGSLGLDEKTKAMLTAGILLVGVLGTVAGAQVCLRCCWWSWAWWWA